MGILDEETSKQIEDVLEEFESIVEEKEVSKEFKIKIKYINKSDNENPIYAKEGDSGFDLRANEGGTLKTLERKLVSTGLFFELPDGYELQIRPRSGLAYKNGVTVLNTPGTVDADYRGEVKVILINHSEVGFFVNHGDRIAQAVIASVIGKNFVKLEKVNNIDENTERGSGGFGSTGVKW